MSNVHIVLATYNAEKFLREQLDSILTGDYQDITIEICDDGSTDDTLYIAREYVSDYPQMISLHENKKNMGYQKNFLEGIRRSKSPYIMLCDQDDIWMKDKVRITLEKMKWMEEKEKHVPLLVYTDAMLYDGEQERELGSFHKNSHLAVDKVDISHLLMENKVIGCTVMINDKVLPFLKTLPDEIRVHDWWLALICSAFGKIGYIECKTLLYRQHSGNMIGSGSFFYYLKKRIFMLREQKIALEATYIQADAFYRLFDERFASNIRHEVELFKKIPKMGFWKRRICCLKHGFLKTGLMRNVALMIMV